MNLVSVDLDAATLLRDLRASRAHAEHITVGLDGARLLGPKLAIVNAPLWEIGHVGWFQEYWCLRLNPDGSLGPSIMEGADALYDSAAVPHATRWDLPLPTIAATRAYAAAVLERVCARLEREPENAFLAYFVRLATFHEDMHAEAFHYTHQTLGYEDPLPAAPVPAAPAGDVELAGGRFRLGAEPGSGFVFDNEKWAYEVDLAPFAIARRCVTNGEYLAFVESGGTAPRYWEKRDGIWGRRRFDAWRPLELDAAVVHVSWEEAQAWCRWAKRRLPSEAEWEFAAKQGALAQSSDTVWQWTDSDFVPYPGYVVDPYKEYSEPWFGTHKVLRGGSFATPARLLRDTWRNFYMADRGDVFAGFRTCALDGA